MQSKLFVMIFMLAGVTAALVRTSSQRALDVVPAVDLNRYAGKWYEIARLPNRFEKKCAGEVTATYALLEGGRLQVVNECRQQNGQMDKAEGVARPAAPGGPNTKLEVRFAPSWLSWLPMVWGDYWIIDLAPDYSYAVVGSPDRKYLWILSRTPQMDEALYQRLVQQTGTKGFAVARLIKTRQSG
jgi:apolipoprotein D and lipocalin family protein